MMPLGVPARIEAIEQISDLCDAYSMPSSIGWLAGAYFDRCELRCAAESPRPPRVCQLLPPSRARRYMCAVGAPGRRFSNGKLVVSAVACLILACKYGHKCYPSMRESSGIAQYLPPATSSADVKRAEMDVLTALEWRMYVVQPHAYLEPLLLELSAGMDESERALTAFCNGEKTGGVTSSHLYRRAEFMSDISTYVRELIGAPALLVAAASVCVAISTSFEDASALARIDALAGAPDATGPLSASEIDSAAALWMRRVAEVAEIAPAELKWASRRMAEHYHLAFAPTSPPTAPCSPLFFARDSPCAGFGAPSLLSTAPLRLADIDLVKPQAVVKPAPFVRRRPASSAAPHAAPSAATLAVALARGAALDAAPPLLPVAADAVAACLQPVNVMDVLLGTAPPDKQ